MKRLLSLKNRIMVTSGLMGLLFTASSFSFGPVSSTRLTEDPPQKKEQRIKVMVNKDGKQIKIDTTFNLPDETMIRHKVDSVLNALDIEVRKPGKSDVVIRRGGRHLGFTQPHAEMFPGEEEFDVFIQQGDSGKVRREKRIIHIGENDEWMTPPVPPVPPRIPMINHKIFAGDSFAFDPNDESVISYDKKDIGKGLEKITIIRKKRPDQPAVKEMDVKVNAKKNAEKNVRP